VGPTDRPTGMDGWDGWDDDDGWRID